MAFDNTGEILAIARNLRGKVPGIDELSERAIAQGWNVSTFQQQALERMTTTPVTTPTGRDASYFASKDVQGYSITRALGRLVEGKQVDGLEGELSAEVAMRTGKRPHGFYVPDAGMMATRNFVAGTGTLGGYLVETQNLGDQFIEVLRNKAQVIGLGARVVDLPGPVTIPKQNAAGATAWVAETAAASLANGNFTQITLTPHAVSAFQQYSKQLLITSNPSIDSIIRDDITQQIGLAIDLAALHGTGGDQPTGLFGTTGINSVALAANGQALNNATAYPFLVSLETEVAADNADSGALAYLLRPGHRGALRTQQRFASTDTPVWDPRAGDRPVNGHRAACTNQLVKTLTTGSATTICSAIVFGDWNQMIIGTFGALDVVVDQYTLCTSGVVRIVARRWLDVAVRTPESFCIGGGIITTH